MCLNNSMILNNMIKYNPPFMPGRVPGSSGALAVFPLGRNTLLLLLTVSTKQFVPGTLTDCYTNRVILGRTPKPSSHPLQAVWNSCFTVEQQRVAAWRFPSVRAGFLPSQRLRCWVNRLNSTLENQKKNQKTTKKKAQCYRFRWSV